MYKKNHLTLEESVKYTDIPYSTLARKIKELKGTSKGDLYLQYYKTKKGREAVFISTEYLDILTLDRYSRNSIKENKETIKHITEQSSQFLERDHETNVILKSNLDHIGNLQETINKLIEQKNKQKPLLNNPVFWCVYIFITIIVIASFLGYLYNKQIVNMLDIYYSEKIDSLKTDNKNKINSLKTQLSQSDHFHQTLIENIKSNNQAILLSKTEQLKVLQDQITQLLKERENQSNPIKPNTID